MASISRCSRFVVASCLALACNVLCHCGGQRQAAAQDYAIHIHLDGDGRIAVDAVDLPAPESVTSKPGILLWTDQQRDRWQVLPTSLPTPTAVEPPIMLAAVNVGSRGEAVETPPSLAMQTASLDQLVGGEILRGVGSGELITPADEQMVLNGAITLRRQASDSVPADADLKLRFPAAQLILRSDVRAPLQFVFPAGKSTLIWSEIEALPDDLATGLPPGEYTLSFVEGQQSVLFGVETKNYRDNVFRHADRYAAVADTTADAVYTQLAVEAMLAAVDEDGAAAPYLVDAYDLLTQLPAEQHTEYLSQIRDRVEQQLRGQRDATAAMPDATGVAVIDRARQRIQAGRWADAQRLLESPAAAATQRSRSLTRLYQGVILAESGAATGDAAYAAFMESLEGMADSPPADAFRAHNNFANYLLGRAQDRAYDHAFQIATGVPAPLFAGLNDWHLARVHFEQAAAIANSLAPQQAASVRANIARQYALLADYIQLLNSAFDSQQQWLAGQQAAAEEARQVAADVVGGSNEQVDSATRAGGYVLLARLAHRNRDAAACRQYAGKALQEYVQDGSLAGVESIHRMIGMSWIREAGENASPSVISDAVRDEALQHLLVSHALSEALRDRFPSDTAGLSRAGFFARRAYVHEQIVELLIADQRAAEALAYAELAKSRSLQDFLTTRSSVRQQADRQPRQLTELLADWPTDTVALEYFLGARRGWVFAVNTRGQVQAYPLLDAAGGPLASRQIVEHVQRFVSGMRGTSRKMFQQHSAGLGFDKTWQDDLHTFYLQLIPADVREQLSASKEVLIVPHHILHYFPFAALVTARDEEQRISIEMPQPTFLIDGPFQLCTAPSLTAWDVLRRQTPEPITDVNAIGITEFSNAPRLPGVEQDLANFTQAFEGHPLATLRGDDADEAAMSEFLKRRGLLFVATHGMNIADQPLESFLLCHAGAGTDGRLTAGEILSQPVGAQVVVMSACYSGLADRSPLPGDDLFGLQRALLQAGATNVVCGLWDVYDETGAQLMNTFFQRLAVGDPVHAALGNSQRAFLKARRAEGSFDPWIHPYFWAVYKATGSDRTTVALP